MQKQKIIYLDILRIISTIAVIGLHVASNNFSNEKVNSLGWCISNIYNSITRWCVPVFVMISGSLFLDRKELTMIDIKRYVFRLIKVYIVWGGIYAIFNLLIYGNTIKGFVVQILFGSYHMWYLYMIIVVYTLIPILLKVVEQMELAVYFLGITFIFWIMLPWGMNMVMSYLGNELPIQNSGLLEMDSHLSLKWSFYYVLGYVLSKLRFSNKQVKIFFYVGLLGLLLTISLSYYYCTYIGTASTSFMGNFTLNVFMQSVGVFVVVKAYFEKKSIKANVCRMIRKFSELTFGIYLVHVLVINILNIVGINSLTLNSVISIPLMIVIVGVISCFISFIIDRVTILRKCMV